MFVQTNTVEAVKHYFRERLQDQFSDSEIRQMLKASVCERLKLSSAEYLLSDRQLLSESDLLYFRSVVKRLLDNEPFQYILGHTDFCGLTINCDKRALIPRPETEELVHWIVEEHEDREGLTVLDLCTGSGCIPLALERLLKNPQVFALELSEGASALAKENKRMNDSRIELIEADALADDAYRRFDAASFDIWVSNPPYVLESDAPQMHENVLKHEPHMALFVEDIDSLLFYRKIAQMAFVYLKPGGRLYFEIHERKAQEMKCLLEELGFNEIEFRKDLQERDRMVQATKY